MTMRLYTFRMKDKTGWANYAYKYVHVACHGYDTAVDVIKSSFPPKSWESECTGDKMIVSGTVIIGESV